MDKRSKIRTGIFPGAFDPIHLAHLAVANYICEYEGIDDLWFTVTPGSPSGRKAILSVPERLDMVEKAIIDYDKFLVSDIETCLPQPNYTLNTLNTLKAKFSLRNFILIMGADNWQNFSKCHGANQIIEDFQIIIYPRKNYPVEINELPATVYLSEAPLIEISSSFIRNSIQNKKDIRFFLPQKIWPYVESYENPVDKN
jgi:nicotinate-nucleotide adenylyltransferase